jgi:3-oxoacyl-[acyl-carrier protein] reductase
MNEPALLLIGPGGAALTRQAAEALAPGNQVSALLLGGPAPAPLPAAVQAEVVAAAADDAALDAALDRLVPAAGVGRIVVCGPAPVHRPVAAEDTASLREALLQDAFLPMAATARAARRLAEGARAVFILPVLAERPAHGFAASSAVAGALLSFAKALALELGPRGVSVTPVCLGWLDEWVREAASTEDDAGRLERYIPQGRLLTAEDCWPAVRFLLEDDVAFVSGSTILLDQGLLARP